MNDTLDALHQAKQDLFNLFDAVCYKNQDELYDTNGLEYLEEAKEALIEFGLIDRKDCITYEE